MVNLLDAYHNLMGKADLDSHCQLGLKAWKHELAGKMNDPRQLQKTRQG